MSSIRREGDSCHGVPPERPGPRKLHIGPFAWSGGFADGIKSWLSRWALAMGEAGGSES